MRNLPRRLRSRTRRYYEYMARQSTFLNESDLLADLSPPLRRDVGVHLNNELLHRVPILRTDDHSFQGRVVSMLSPTVVLAGEYVVCVGDVGYEMYFVLNGRLSVINLEGHVMYYIGAGSFFGENMLLSNTRSTLSYR